MTSYPENATLESLQQYVKDKCHERGFDKAGDLETFLLFMEEVGEMAKAIRDRRGLFQEGDPKQEHLAEEMSDVLSYLLELANRFRVDLNAALRRKEALNDRRSWK